MNSDPVKGKGLCFKCGETKEMELPVSRHHLRGIDEKVGGFELIVSVNAKCSEGFSQQVVCCGECLEELLIKAVSK